MSKRKRNNSCPSVRSKKLNFRPKGNDQQKSPSITPERESKQGSFIPREAQPCLPSFGAHFCLLSNGKRRKKGSLAWERKRLFLPTVSDDNVEASFILSSVPVISAPRASVSIIMNAPIWIIPSDFFFQITVKRSFSSSFCPPGDISPVSVKGLKYGAPQKYRLSESRSVAVAVAPCTAILPKCCRRDFCLLPSGSPPILRGLVGTVGRSDRSIVCPVCSTH